MDGLQREFKSVSASYGDTVLNPGSRLGLSSLIGNPRLSGYLEHHHPEILTEFRAIVAPRRWKKAVKRQAIGTPDRHGKGTPHGRRDRLVPVANRRAPRASRSALTSDGAARAGGACLPTGASRGGTQARCLKRQLSLPVSMISQ
jgi:hypothetical protein